MSIARFLTLLRYGEEFGLGVILSLVFYFASRILFYFVLELVAEGLECETPGIYVTSGLCGT